MSSKQQKRSSSKVFVITFSDDIDEVKLIPRLRDSLVELSFYQDDEIATFRYEAFCAAIGVDPDFGDGPVLSDEAVVIFDDDLEAGENASSLSSLTSSSSPSATTIPVPSSNDKTKTIEVPSEIIAATNQVYNDHLLRKSEASGSSCSPPQNCIKRKEMPAFITARVTASRKRTRSLVVGISPEISMAGPFFIPKSMQVYY